MTLAKHIGLTSGTGTQILIRLKNTSQDIMANRSSY